MKNYTLNTIKETLSSRNILECICRLNNFYTQKEQLPIKNLIDLKEDYKIVNNFILTYKNIKVRNFLKCFISTNENIIISIDIHIINRF